MQVRPSTIKENSFKNISDAPPRLQRLTLKIQPYDFKIKYITGKEVAFVDPQQWVLLSPYMN